MSKSKLFASLALVVALAGLCLYLNRGSFADKPIQISHRISPWLQRGQPREARPLTKASPVVFSFDRYYQFTEIKVVKADEMATNKFAHPLWHLVSDSNSVATASFAYAEAVPGMQPKVAGIAADPLVPGVKYRLIVMIGGKEAEHEFSTTATR